MIRLTLTICEGFMYSKRREVFWKQVDWPAVPPDEAWIGFGIDENGEECGYSMQRVRVYWSSSGDVDVQGEIDNLQNDDDAYPGTTAFDACVACAKRDGFLTYDEAKEAGVL